MDVVPPTQTIPPAGLFGTVSVAPVALGAPFTVVCPGFAAGLAFEIHRWQSRASTLPLVGDECLVIEDDNQEPWVPAWWPAAGDLPITGEKGEKGATGATGPAGPTGPEGPAGTSGFESGDIKQTARATAPSGWLICEGQSLLRAGEYAALFAAIGTEYGSVDATHFTIPDGRGRALYGKGTHADLNSLSDNDAIPVTSRTPSHVHVHTHTHSVSGTTSAGNAGEGYASGGQGSNNNTHTHTFSVTSGAASSANTAAEIVPYIVINHLIKI